MDVVNAEDAVDPLEPQPDQAPAAAHPREPVDKHIAVVLVVLILISITGQVFAKFLSDLFGPEDYGLLTIVLSIIGLWQMTFNFRLRAGLDYMLARQRSGEGGVPPIERATGLCLAFDILAMIALAGMLFIMAPHLAAWYKRPDATIYLRLLSGFLLLQPFTDVVETLWKANKRFAVSSMATFSRTLVPSLTALIVGWAVGPTKDRLFYAILGYGLGMAAVSIAWTIISFSQIRFCPNLWKERRIILQLGKIAWPVWFGELIKGCQPALLQLLAGYIFLGQAGVMRIAQVIINPSEMIGWAVRTVAMPLMAERPASQRSGIADLLLRAHNFLLFPTLAVLLIAGPTIIRTFFDPEFHSATRYVPILVLMVLANSFVRVASWILVSSGKAITYTWVMGGVALVSIPGMFLSALWTKNIMAAACWMTAGWYVGAAITLYLIHVFGIRLNWRKSFAEPALWAALTALVVYLTLNQGLIVIAAASLIAIVLPALTVRRHLRTLRAVAA
jgi:O-antigen/teichoic acid export membrane protein